MDVVDTYVIKVSVKAYWVEEIDQDVSSREGLKLGRW
jgi:hypothetical protein